MNPIPSCPSAPPAPAAVRRFGLRLLLLALIWLGLNGADFKSWIVGGPVVFTAAWLSLQLLPNLAWHWTIGGALVFAGFFFRESLRGGWDVARRALAPRLTLNPDVVDYPTRLPAGPARWFFCNVISLLPGTAVVEIEEQRLRVHVLEVSPQTERELRALEGRVAGLFGCALPGRREKVA